MRTLGNIVWHFPFFGFVNATLVYLLGLLLTVTIVAAPVGLGLMELGKFLLAPFSRTMVSKADLDVKQNEAWKVYSIIVMLIYLPLGIVLCAYLLVQVVALFVSIVGIPVAIVVAKSLGTCLNPVNKQCVHRSVRDEIDRRRARSVMGHHPGG